jgi:hypothetical protein
MLAIQIANEEAARKTQELDRLRQALTTELSNAAIARQQAATLTPTATVQDLQVDRQLADLAAAREASKMRIAELRAAREASEARVRALRNDRELASQRLQQIQVSSAVAASAAAPAVAAGPTTPAPIVVVPATPPQPVVAPLLSPATSSEVSSLEAQDAGTPETPSRWKRAIDRITGR